MQSGHLSSEVQNYWQNKHKTNCKITDKNEHTMKFKFTGKGQIESPKLLAKKHKMKSKIPCITDT